MLVRLSFFIQFFIIVIVVKFCYFVFTFSISSVLFSKVCVLGTCLHDFILSNSIRPLRFVKVHRFCVRFFPYYGFLRQVFLEQDRIFSHDQRTNTTWLNHVWVSDGTPQTRPLCNHHPSGQYLQCNCWVPIHSKIDRTYFKVNVSLNILYFLTSHLTTEVLVPTLSNGWSEERCLGFGHESRYGTYIVPEFSKNNSIWTTQCWTTKLGSLLSKMKRFKDLKLLW